MFNMNNEQQQTMAAFIQWLPQNIKQFEGSLPKEIIEPIATAQSPEEVVNVLNQLSQSQEGNQVVSAMFQAFQKSSTGKKRTPQKDHGLPGHWWPFSFASEASSTWLFHPTHGKSAGYHQQCEYQIPEYQGRG